MTLQSRDRAPYWIAAAAAAVAALRAWLASPGMLFFSFQVRDLERAAEVAAGHWILWGPEMTGGGHLPGGLYYWLLAIPLRLGMGWKGAWVLICLLWVAASAAAGFLLARAYGSLAALLAAAYFFLPIAVLQNFLNVSATPPFIVAADRKSTRLNSSHT